jgi:hypothetical protein
MFNKAQKLYKKVIRVSFLLVTFLGPSISVMRNATGMSIN